MDKYKFIITIFYKNLEKFVVYISVIKLLKTNIYSFYDICMTNFQ